MKWKRQPRECFQEMWERKKEGKVWRKEGRKKGGKEGGREGGRDLAASGKCDMAVTKREGGEGLIRREGNLTGRLFKLLF